MKETRIRMRHRQRPKPSAFFGLRKTGRQVATMLMLDGRAACEETIVLSRVSSDI